MIENLYASFINLDHRTDRLAHMTEQLSKISLKVERTRGIPWKEIPESPQTQVMRNRTPGAIGCHFSQVAVMKEAHRQGKHAAVFEDDIIFCDDFDKRLEYIDRWCEFKYPCSAIKQPCYIPNKCDNCNCSEQARDWDVIWLGASFHVNPPFWHKFGQSGMPPDCSAQLGKDCEPTDDPRMIRTYGAYVTFAYIVNFNSMEKIFKLFDEHLHTSIGIDWLFIKLQPQLKCFSFVPGCVMQMDNLSDIGNGMTVWSGQLNNGPYVFQKRMEDFEPTTYKWN